MIMSLMTTPCLASDGEVRKNRPLSSMVDRAGEVAEGEIMTIPLGMATLVRAAVVTPEQSPPTTPATPSEVMRRSMAAVAAAASTQVVSARIAVTVVPSSSLPEALTSAIAASAPGAMLATSDSNGPVSPRNTPTLISSAAAVLAMVPRLIATAVLIINFFMIVESPFLFFTHQPGDEDVLNCPDVSVWQFC